MKESEKAVYGSLDGISRFFIIAALALMSANLFSQGSVVKPSKQTAFDAFKIGNYELAYREFNILLLSYPKDPLYNYYAGVSLVMMRREPDKAAGYLLAAVAGSQAVKAVPADAWFFLGRAQQMSGEYPEAIKSYMSFSDNAGRKANKEYKVSAYIEECNARKGELTFAESLKQDPHPMPRPESDDSTSVIVGQNMNIPVISKPVRKREDLPPVYENALEDAMDKQVKADSLNRLAEAYKKDLVNVPSQQKASAQSRIRETEAAASAYQKSADKIFLSLEGKAGMADDSVSAATAGSIKDNPLNTTQGNKSVSNTVDQKSVVPEPPEEQKSTGVYSQFEVMKGTALQGGQPVKIDPDMPEGLVYRIQMAVLSKPVSSTIFKGITPVFGFRVPGSDAVKYYAGQFRKMSDASKALGVVKQLGFKDSFIVAVFDGKPVSPDRAALLEKEWGGRSLINGPVQNRVNTVDTAPPTLAFRVEVARTDKPVEAVQTDLFRKMAGNRGLDIINATDGKYVYLIGNFITFESASDYADLLVRNGYRDAKVVAWLGNREIPVETAKQLFERIE